MRSIQKKTEIVGIENLQKIITREISKYARSTSWTGGRRVKGRNYDRVGNSQVVLERQGMDEEKATKWWNCQKNTFSTFHRAVRLHSRIQWKIDANYANVYVKVHSTVLLASTIFFRQKMCFLALHQYITTAMNMIGGNLTEVSIVIFFFLFLCSS